MNGELPEGSTVMPSLRDWISCQRVAVPGGVVVGLLRVGDDRLGRADREVAERAYLRGAGEPDEVGAGHVDERAQGGEPGRVDRTGGVVGGAVGVPVRDGREQR